MKYCLTLELKDNPDLINEYRFWHRPENIWKEIPLGIKEAGIENMEIYIWQNRLFMIIEMADHKDYDAVMKILGTLQRQEEWENFMNKYQQKPAGANDQTKWQFMENIFRLSDC